MELAKILREKARQLTQVAQLLCITAEVLDRLRTTNPDRRPMELAAKLRKNAKRQIQLKAKLRAAADVIDLSGGNDIPGRRINGVQRLFDLLYESAEPLTLRQMFVQLKERQLALCMCTIKMYLSRHDVFVKLGDGYWTVGNF
jgi:hypothetical protein